MIAKFNCRVYKEKNNLFLLTIYAGYQEEMEIFLETKVGINQTHWIDQVDNFKKYPQFDGMYYEYIKGLRFELKNDLFIDVIGENFIIEFPIFGKYLLNVKESEVSDLIKNLKTYI